MKKLILLISILLFALPGIADDKPKEQLFLKPMIEVGNFDNEPQMFRMRTNKQDLYLDIAAGTIFSVGMISTTYVHAKYMDKDAPPYLLFTTLILTSIPLVIRLSK